MGHITETGLSGRVIHTGIIQKDIDKGYSSMVAFGYGYTYDMWCMHDVEVVGKLINYTSVYEYINFLNTATNEQIKMYFKAERLLKDTNLLNSAT